MNKKNSGSSSDSRPRAERAECITLSERDTVHVLTLLKHPPPPNQKLAAAAKAWAANYKKQTSEPPYGDEHEK